MTGGPVRPAAAAAADATARRTVTRFAAARVWRGGLVVASVAAGMSAVVVATYRSTVGDSLDLAALAALAGNPAIRTLFGEPVALDRPGGFAVWRTAMVLSVLLAVWGLLAATRTTRGEEETGRWNLLLAGRVPLPAVLLRHLGVLVALQAVAGAAVAAALVLAGAAPAGAVVHGAGLALVGAFFVAAGGLAAQLFAARPAASGAAAAVLAAGVLVRMVGDGVAGLGWWRWLSPFGLLALSRPYQDGQTLVGTAAPLLVLAAATATLLAAAVHLAGRRDVQAGVLAGRTGRSPRLRLLGSVEAFALRGGLPPLAGWAAGAGAFFLLIGLLAASMTEFLSGNPVFAEAAAGAGFAGLGTVDGYAATLFELLAVPAGLFVAVRLAAVSLEESRGRLTLLCAQPIGRVRLLGAEMLSALAGTAGLLTVAALATWLGVAVTGNGITVGAALAGTWNVLPIVLLSLGAAVFALGWAPDLVLVAGALPGAGGFLLKVIAESTAAPHWVRDLSPFSHLAPVPLLPPDWPASALMTGLAVGFGLLGLAGYRWRDLRG